MLESPVKIKLGTTPTPSDSSAPIRMSALCGFLLVGIIGLAYGVSRLPLRYSAQATFDVPVDVAVEYGQLPVDPQAVFDALTRIGASPGLAVHHSSLLVEESAASPARVVVTAELEDPALVQHFVLALAREVADSYVSTPSSEENPDHLPFAPRADHQVTPVSHADPDRESADVVCMPALAPSHRTQSQTLLENALAECLAQRERWVARYTKQHPVVASLDRKIRGLKQEMEPSPSTAERGDRPIVQTSAEQQLLVESTHTPVANEHHPVTADGGASMQPRLGPDAIKYVGFPRRMIFVAGATVLIFGCVGIEIAARRRCALVPHPARIRRS